MSKIKQLYVNGCSFTNDPVIYYTNKQKQYCDFFKDKYQFDVINRGVPGSCNRRIIRTTLRDCLQFDSTTAVILQLTNLYRTEVDSWDQSWQRDDYFDPSQEEIFHSVKFVDDSNSKPVKDFIKSKSKVVSEKQMFDELMVDLVMLTSYLDSKDIKYFVYSHDYVFDPKLQPHDSIFFRKIKDNKNITSFFEPLSYKLTNDECFYDTPHGHLTEKGHYEMFKQLDTLIDIFD